MTKVQIQRRSLKPATVALAASCGLALLAASCGADVALSECESLHATDCDLREDECREGLNELVRCIRGDDQPTPEVEFLSPEKYLVRYPSVGSEPSEDYARVIRGLRLLWLVEKKPSSDEPQPAVPAAVYDLDLRRIVIVDDTDTRAYLRAVGRGHVDTASGGLASIFDADLGSFDQAIAALSIYLGEGTFYGDAAWWKTRAMEQDAFIKHVELNLYYQDQIADAQRYALEHRFDHSTVGSAFAVAYGPAMVMKYWLAGDAESVRDAYSPLVQSTAQLLRGDLSSQGRTAFADPWPVLPQGLVYMGEDSLGAWLLHTYLMRTVPRPKDRTVAEDMAEAERTGALWEGDRVAFIYSEAMDKVATVWQVEVNDELWSPEVQLAWRVTPKNGRLTFFAAESEELMAEVFDAFAVSTTSDREVRPGVVRPALRAELRGLQGP